MPARSDSMRILRTAAWIWIGFLLAMAVMDLIMYTRVRTPIPQILPALAQPVTPGQQLPPLNPPPPQGFRLFPVYLFYAANGLVAFTFLLFTYWDWIQNQLGRAFYPLLLSAVSAAPIFINILIVPRFPQGPLSNAEGMALRQLPVLFVALALVAWEYRLPHVIFFSVATTGLELGDRKSV